MADIVEKIFATLARYGVESGKLEQLPTAEKPPIPDADTLHEEMQKRAQELGAVNKRMEEARLNREAEERVKEKVQAIKERMAKEKSPESDS